MNVMHIFTLVLKLKNIIYVKTIYELLLKVI